MDLSGLESLRVLNQNLIISGNAVLNSIQALQFLEVDSVSGLTLGGNPLLTECAILPICNVIKKNSKNVTIGKNGTGCTSYFDIYHQCNLTDTCLSNLFFTAQSDIDLFPSLFPNCSNITGDIYIKSSSIDPIKNLDSLYQVFEIGGSLRIQRNDSLADLTGLRNISSIGKDLQINNNGLLINLNGLDHISQLDGNLYVGANPLLTSLFGLENLNQIKGDVEISWNPYLINLDGLAGLRNIDGNFNIEYENELTGMDFLDSVKGTLIIESINGSGRQGFGNLKYTGGLRVRNNFYFDSLFFLSSLEKIGGDVVIQYNNQLSTLSGMQHLQWIVGDLILTKNLTLKDISALSGLNKLDRSLSITELKLLDNLTGLDNLGVIPGNLEINLNTSLKDLNGLAHLKEVHGSLTIFENDSLLNLNGLGLLTRIGGDFLLESNKSINEFGNMLALDSIGGLFSLKSNPNTSCAGFDHLKGIGGELRIQSNNNLITLNGLDSLRHTGGVNISSNDLLSQIDALSGLTHIEGDFSLSSNNKVQAVPNLDQVLVIGGNLFLASPKLSSIHGLNRVQSIRGSLVIQNTPLSSLDGLQQLTQCDGSIKILKNTNLQNLDALVNLKKMNGFIEISDNRSLINISGIQNIAPDGIHSAGNVIKINNNQLLSECSISPVCDLLLSPEKTFIIEKNAPGCNGKLDILVNCNLSNSCFTDSIVFTSQSQIDNISIDYPDCTFINGSVTIKEEIPGNITNLNGLSKITLVSGSLKVLDNRDLSGLQGLEQLYGIGGTVALQNNTNLTDIQALQSVDSKIINTREKNEFALVIKGNSHLSSCSTNTICSLLTMPGIQYVIEDNGVHCQSPSQVIDSCGFLPYCTISAWPSQQTINEFPIRFPKCTVLREDLYIYELISNTITSVAPLSQITKINGDILIQGTSLTNFHGLENLTSVDGNLVIQMTKNLTSLKGLENVVSIHGNLFISNNQSLNDLTDLDALTNMDGGITVETNNNLANLNGLNQLIEINGPIFLNYNPLLENIDAIANINPESIHPFIDHLRIKGNPKLSACSIHSICALLQKDDVVVDINSNDTNCNSSEEILNECTVAVTPVSENENILIYPNPTSGTLFIDLQKTEEISSISVFNMIGERIQNMVFEENISMQDLPNGIYMIILHTKNSKVYSKRILLLK